MTTPVTVRLATTGLAGSAFAFPILGMVAPLGVAVLAVLGGLASAPLALASGGWRHAPRAALLLVGGVGAWALLSAAWALDPGQAVLGALRFAGQGLLGLTMLLAAFLLPDRSRRLVCRGLMGGIGVALLLYLLALVGSWSHLLPWRASPTEVAAYTKRGVCVLVLLIWPLWAMMRGRLPTGQGVAVGLVLALVVASGHSSSAKCALISAIGAAGLVFAWPRRGPAVLAGLLTAGILALPLAAVALPPPTETFQNWTFLPNSAHHRLTIWQFTARHILDKPVQGWGMNASRVIPGADDEIPMRRVAADGQVIEEVTEPQLPLHPHNAVLQIWLELGAPGVLALVALLIWLLCRAPEPATPTARIDQARRAALIVATITVGAGAFGIWQGWWQTVLWLLVVLEAVALPRPPSLECPDLRINDGRAKE